MGSAIGLASECRPPVQQDSLTCSLLYNFEDMRIVGFKGSVHEMHSCDHVRNLVAELLSVAILGPFRMYPSDPTRPTRRSYVIG